MKDAKGFRWSRLLLFSIPLLAEIDDGASFQQNRFGLQPCTARQKELVLMTNADEKDDDQEPNRRRALLFTAGAVLPTSASAALFGRGKKDLYFLDTRDEISDSVRTEQVDTPDPTLSSQYALLKVLPVKNPVFRTLESNVEQVSLLRSQGRSSFSRKDMKAVFKLGSL
jgi:hypothetical protein